ncbi:plasmid mobilization protein [Rubrivirga marina]|uniref:Uncharacterized protein n=1 Tax=Rubrivirga marina TaxID=1196024 RepID=A0A271ITM8_9BACT|nr:hypothetical protein BSZ37_20505 [Rubrivirga marina]
MRFSSIKNSPDSGALPGGAQRSESQPGPATRQAPAVSGGALAKVRRQRTGGRPPRKPEEGPKVQVGFQVTSVERDQIREAASQAGLSVSEFLRRRALGRPVVPLADAAARKALRRIGVNLNQLVRRANAGGATEAKAQAAIAEVRAAVARVGRAAGDDGLEGTP